VWVKSKSHCYFPSSFSLTSFWAVISRSGVSFFSFVLAKFWRGRPEHPKSSIDKVLAGENTLRTFQIRGSDAMYVAFHLIQ
jgi:hypothetical protein